MASRHYVSLIKKSIFLFLLIGMSVSSAADISQGYAWLATQQQADGSIESAPSLTHPLQSTLESLITFQTLDQQDSSVIASALTYLSVLPTESTEDLSLRLLASPLNISDFSTIISQIAQRQNNDGGVGAFSEFGSDLLSSTYALRVFSRAGIANESTNRLASYLLNTQNPEGSWSLQDNPNRVEITATVINALWLYRQAYQLGGALDNGVNYLENQRGANSLWLGLEASALSLSAVLNVKLDRAPYELSLNAFLNLQNTNGSFGDDVYLTALSLRVIDASQKPASDEIRLSGRVVDGDSGTALTGAVIQLTGPDSLSQISDVDGQFTLLNLTAGAYTLTVSVDGFSELTLNILLPFGSKADLGNLQLSRLQTDPNTGEPILTGVVRGTITDRRTGAPLSGAAVNINGTSLSTMTNQSGEYQLSAVPEGDIQLNVSAVGYEAISATTNLAARQTLVFSPALQEQVALGVLVQGTITDRITGSPLEGVQIQVVGGDSQPQIVVSDTNGNYSLGNIVAGNIALEAYHPVSAATMVDDGIQLVFSPQMDLLSQSPEIPLGGLTGVIIDSATGRGVELAQVTLSYDSAEVFVQQSGQDGEFIFNGLPQGSANLNVSLVGYTSLSGTLDSQLGLVTNIGSIELQPENVPTSGELSGFVVDVRTKSPINGALISARNTTTNLLTEMTGDTQGLFSLTNLIASEYEITVSFTDYNPQQFTAVVAAGNTLDLGEIRLRQPGVDALLADLAITELDNNQVQSSQSDFLVS
ncbi:MAG: hypothetical protein ACJAZJ_001158, partial [Candidatus Endobugula sp.]